ncbi:MAG: hypothetical protein E7G96_02755, partial [Serratia liquefaciens]|nr:hypothetical protein [Serratia liquefaciens]
MANSYLNIPVPTPTQDPVPSAKIQDHVFAGAKLDEIVTSENEKYTDRLGVERSTWSGISKNIEKIITSLDVSNFTFGITTEDPDGTASGLAATTDGQFFRVAQGGDKGFIYYKNNNGSALQVASLPGTDYITNEVARLDAKIAQSAFTEDTFPRAFNIGDGINLPGSAVIKISSISIGDISLFIAWYLSLTSGSEVARRWFLPPNTMYIGGELKTNFNRVRFSDLFSAEIAEVSDAIIRVRYQIPGKFNFTPSADMKQIHDLSGVFASMNYSNIAAATERGVSNHQTVGAIQFVITPSEMTAAGYNPTDNYSILSYLGNIARNCEFLTHPADADFANVKT